MSVPPNRGGVGWHSIKRHGSAGPQVQTGDKSAVTTRYSVALTLNLPKANNESLQELSPAQLCAERHRSI